MKHKRGADFVKGLAKFVSLLTDEGIDNAKNFVLPILAQAEFSRDGEKALKGIQINILEFITEQL